MKERIWTNNDKVNEDLINQSEALEAIQHFLTELKVLEVPISKETLYDALNDPRGWCERSFVKEITNNTTIKTETIGRFQLRSKNILEGVLLPPLEKLTALAAKAKSKMQYAPLKAYTIEDYRIFVSDYDKNILINSHSVYAETENDKMIWDAHEKVASALNELDALLIKLGKASLQMTQITTGFIKKADTNGHVQFMTDAGLCHSRYLTKQNNFTL